MAQIEKIKSCPEAFDVFVGKLNEVIAELNARDMEAGPGVSITRSDTKTIIELGTLTATGECNETGGIDITIEGT